MPDTPPSNKTQAKAPLPPTLSDAGLLHATQGAPGGALPGIVLSAGSRPLPEYELVRALGRGGFGEVWLAKGPGGFDVALKFVRLGEKVGATELRALELMKGLRHAHLLLTFGAWQQAGYLIVAMELADGTLLDRLHQAEDQGRTGLPREELLEHMRDAARGLDYLSEAGATLSGNEGASIQHKDVKPQNLLLVGGTVKVADFGLARVLEHTVTAASGGLTPAYAPPEFFNGKATRWSDQYSLAMSYCHLRGGRLPFEGHAAQIMAGHLMRVPKLDMVPSGERAAVARALAKKPEERWPTCRAFVEALHTPGRKGPPPLPLRPASSAVAPVAPKRPAVPGGSGRLLPWLVGMLALAVVVFGVVWLSSRPSPRGDRLAQTDLKSQGEPPTKPAVTEHPPKRSNPVKGPAKPTKEPPKEPKSTPRPPSESLRDPVVPRPKPAVTRPRPSDSDPFPRRALIISVHNYLFANPVQSGVPGLTHNVGVLPHALNNGLRIPLDQILHLSDAAKSGRSRWPVKKAIEDTLTGFLDTTRPQDRILVFFIGHAVEIGDKPYLVPIEGELGEADTLIPLEWVYDKLARCKARQKVLVLDAFRNNPTLGQERPTAGAMGPKTDAMLRTPPLGVQVWSSCVEKQYSYETDDSPMGTFLAELYDNTRRGLEGKIQHREDPLPLEPYLERINGGMKKELDRLGLVQVSRLTGTAPAEGAAYDPGAPPAPTPTLAAGIPMDDSVGTLIAKVEEEVGTPPVRVSADDRSINLAGLPPFDPAVMKKYEDDGKGDPKSPLRVAVRKARAALWAVNVIPPPKELETEVQKYKNEMRVDLRTLKEGYRAPGPGNAEKRFKDQLFRDEETVGRMFLSLNDVLEELKSDKVKEERDAASKRWQANYDFVLARVEAQIACLYEYLSMLGQMRKEFPRRDPELHGGWKLAARTTLSGDSAGRKLAKDANKILDKLAKQHKGTPWAILARRVRLTALGMEWRPTR